MYRSENFQKCGVYVRFDFASYLSSKKESLHTLSNVNNKCLIYYHTSGAKLAASRLPGVQHSMFTLC